MLSLIVSSSSVKPAHIAVLKFLALRGATKHPVDMSSEKLAEKFDVSQQSGSRYILNLVDKGLLERNLGRKGQILSLTPKAIDILKNEFNEYRLVFDAPEKIKVTGIVKAEDIEVSNSLILRGLTSKSLNYILEKEKLDEINVAGVLSFNMKSCEAFK